jgi:hypothetical protein
MPILPIYKDIKLILDNKKKSTCDKLVLDYIICLHKTILHKTISHKTISHETISHETTIDCGIIYTQLQINKCL